MKIVLAGATGFIGAPLVELLGKENHDLVLLTRRHRIRQGSLPGRLTMAEWDGATVGSWSGHLDGADAVINFAGEPLDAHRWTPARKERIISSRVNAAGALRKAIARAQKKPSVVVNASAVGYYGPRDDEGITEEAPHGSGFLAETCVRWEEAAMSMSAEVPRIVILRCGVVLGKEGGALRKMLLPFKLFAGGTLGSGTQWLPWVHREDLVRVIGMVIGDPAVRGPVNVVAPESVTMKAFCSALGRTLHRPSWAPVPSVLLRLLLGEMAGMVLTGQRVVPAKLQQLGYAFRFPALTPALADLLQ